MKVIGRGGEHITRVQSLTGAKVKIGSAGEGKFLPDRTCTITDSQGAIR